MDAVKIANKISKEHGTIKNVYFLACGGSLVDLYPGYYFLRAESAVMDAQWIPAREFALTPPRKLGKDSLLVICSHSGKTKECLEAAKAGMEAGAAVVTMTHAPGSACDTDEWISIVYDWAPGVKEAEKPQGIVLRLLNELMKIQEPGYGLYDKIAEGFDKIDEIIAEAVKDQQNAAWLFAEKYSEEPNLYIMASGASYSQAYGFAICSLQEMQWMDCGYLNSAEYFHGPFEVTDEDHLYILMMSRGRNRMMDERVLTFLEKYGRKYLFIGFYRSTDTDCLRMVFLYLISKGCENMEKSLEQLKQEYEKTTVLLEQEKRKMQRLKNRQAYLESGSRKQRTHRLITRGAAVESIVPQTKELTETEFYSLMESILNLPQAEHFIRSATENHARISGQEKGGD